MACGCGCGPEFAPQDPYHAAFECGNARPFWEAAVSGMDACVAKGPASDVASWAKLSFQQKCKWGLTASHGGYQPQIAGAMHAVMAASVAKFMSGVIKLYDVVSLRSLRLPYVCMPAPTVLQGVVLMTRPPRGGVPNPDAVHVLVWPAVSPHDVL